MSYILFIVVVVPLAIILLGLMMAGIADLFRPNTPLMRVSCDQTSMANSYDRAHKLKQTVAALRSQGKYCPPEILAEAERESDIAQQAIQSYFQHWWPRNEGWE